MPPAPIGTGGGGDGEGGGADALEDVTLGHFTADPTAIGPFDHSLLSWHVNGVNPPVQVLLDTTQVTAAGQAVVQPAVTASYTLSAKAGAARKILGHVTVSVDTSTCDEVELLNLLTLLREQVIIGIANRSDTYWYGDLSPNAFPNHLSVSLSDGPLPRILIRAVFRQRVPYIPDAWVTLELAFGLGIQNGAFVAVVPSSKGSVDFDPVTSFFGGILLGLALALNNADERATQAGNDMIAGLIQYINIVELHPSVGKSPRSAVVTHRDGRPFIGFVECSVGPQGVTVVLTDVASTMSPQSRPLETAQNLPEVLPAVTDRVTRVARPAGGTGLIGLAVTFVAVPEQVAIGFDRQHHAVADAQNLPEVLPGPGDRGHPTLHGGIQLLERRPVRNHQRGGHRAQVPAGGERAYRGEAQPLLDESP